MPTTDLAPVSVPAVAVEVVATVAGLVMLVVMMVDSSWLVSSSLDWQLRILKLLFFFYFFPLLNFFRKSEDCIIVDFNGILWGVTYYRM